MKKLIVFLFMATISITAVWAQQKPIEVQNLTMSELNKTVLVSWSSTATAHQNSWKVEASTDNKHFETIGLVLGAMPATENHYQFKLNRKKMKASYSFFRVVAVEASGIGWASPSVQNTK